MTRVINFTKIRFVMIALSVVVIISGIVGTVSQGGFNLGIDFEAGLNQRIQIAPVGIELTYSGESDATVNVENEALTIEVRGEEGVRKHSFPFSEYGTLADLVSAIGGLEAFGATLKASGEVESSAVTTGLSFPEELGDDPTSINIVNQNTQDFIDINEVRRAVSELGSPQVQLVGEPANQEFMIRVADPGGDRKKTLESEITQLLEENFGSESVVLKRSDYVGPQFSEALAQQSVSLIIMALVFILIYIWVRFRFGYAISAIAALTHDVIIMLIFIGSTQLEVSTTTIAAVLTIIGYSLNDTIVVFDRVRENESLLQGRAHSEIINTSITQSLSRTLITSLTTMLAVLALYFFGSGPIKDFSLNLIVGIIVGTYSSIYIASPTLLGWWNSRYRKQRKKQGLSPTPTEKELQKMRDEEEAPAVESDEQKPAAAASASTGSKVSNPERIPAAERKLKGKRQKKKKKK